jgi:hypothetical protein
MRKLVYLMVFIAPLVGCQTQAQREWTSKTDQQRAAVAAFQQCVAKLTKQEWMPILKERLVAGESDPQYLKKISSTDMATPKEIEVLYALSAARRPCWGQLIQDTAAFSPEFPTLHSRVAAEADEDLLLMIDGKLNWGDASKRALKRVREWQAEEAVILDRVKAHVNQSHTAELQARQQSTIALQNWLYQQQQLNQQQQLINSLNRPEPPRTTNCNWMGNTLNCRSF